MAQTPAQQRSSSAAAAARAVIRDALAGAAGVGLVVLVLALAGRPPDAYAAVLLIAGGAGAGMLAGGLEVREARRRAEREAERSASAWRAHLERLEVLADELHELSAEAHNREPLEAFEARLAVEVVAMAPHRNRGGRPRGAALPGSLADCLPHLAEAERIREAGGSFAAWCAAHVWPDGSRVSASTVRGWLAREDVRAALAEWRANNPGASFSRATNPAPPINRAPVE
jgi:hypothetical protein